MQLDAKAQSFQIIGGLLGNIRLLELVFVLNGGSQEDIYSYFLNLLENALASSSTDPLRVTLEDAIERVYEASRKKPLDTLLRNNDYSRAGVWNIVHSKIVTRDFVKRVLMFTSYNKSTIQTIKDEMVTCFHLENRKDPYYYFSSAMTSLVQWLLQKLHSAFPQLQHLKRLFGQLACLGVLLNQGIYISINSPSCAGEPLNRSFLQNYPKQHMYKVQKWSRKVSGGKNITMYFYDLVKDENGVVLLDSRKNQNALLPNTIHHLDAEILYLTISKLLDRKIPVLAIHDAYYTSFSCIKEVKESYMDSFISVLERKPLLTIIRNCFDFWSRNDSTFKEVLGALDFAVLENDLLCYKPLRSLRGKHAFKGTKLAIYKHLKVIIDSYNVLRCEASGCVNPSALVKLLKERPNDKILG